MGRDDDSGNRSCQVALGGLHQGFPKGPEGDGVGPALVDGALDEAEVVGGFAADQGADFWGEPKQTDSRSCIWFMLERGRTFKELEKEVIAYDPFCH